MSCTMIYVLTLFIPGVIFIEVVVDVFTFQRDLKCIRMHFDIWNQGKSIFDYKAFENLERLHWFVIFFIIWYGMYTTIDCGRKIGRNLCSLIIITFRNSNAGILI